MLCNLHSMIESKEFYILERGAPSAAACASAAQPPTISCKRTKKAADQQPD
jgi:hypothetical protein